MQYFCHFLGYGLRNHTGIVAACISIMIATSAANATPHPHGNVKETKHERTLGLSKWNHVMLRYQQQRKTAARLCREEPCTVAQWEALILEQRTQNRLAQIESVNRFFNQVSYIEDAENYGREDYWATPYELLARGGDCEDYAIAKYLTLRRLGVPDSHLRIIVLEDMQRQGMVHAVLEVRIGGTRYLLDNQSETIMHASSVIHYRPLFGINRKGWWSFS